MISEVPIGDLVADRETWDPSSAGVGEFDYIDLGSVDKERKEITGVETLPRAEAPSRARQIVHAGDVLVATVRPNLNGVARVLPRHSGMTASTGFTVLRPKPDLLDSGYLFHWVRTQTFIDRMVAVATGASYPAVSDTKVKASTIPLPPIPEQHHVATVLDAADDVRRNREATLGQLEKLIQSVFLEMFGDPVTNPQGWEVVEFGTVIDARLGKMLDKGTEIGDEQYPYLGNSNVQWGRFDFDDLKTMDFLPDEREKFSLQHGDLLVCEGGEVGRAAIWRDEGRKVFFQKALHRVRVDESVLTPEYVYFYLKNMADRGGFAHLTNSSTIAHLTGVKLKRLPLPLPPVDRQHRFSEFLLSAEVQQSRLEDHLAELDTLFASLQSRAFRGQL